MLCWNLPSSPKHWWLLQKSIALREGNNLLVGDFCANLDETKADMGQRDGTGNGLSNIKDTFAEFLELRMSVLCQSVCIFKPGLSSLYDGRAKDKEKVPDISEPNQNVETTCNSKLKFT